MFIEGVLIVCSEGATEVAHTHKFFCMHGSNMTLHAIPVPSDSGTPLKQALVSALTQPI